MRDLLCAACIITGIKGKVSEADTIYQGQALCLRHLSKAMNSGEKKGPWR